MPLMKVRREDDTGWYTVDHLNFNQIGIGINEPITLSKNKEKIKAICNNKEETIAYESYVNNKIGEKLNEYIPFYKINTSMYSNEQKDFKVSYNRDDSNKMFLLERRTLKDKNNETFHILNYWDGFKWVPLNNIWG